MAPHEPHREQAPLVIDAVNGDAGLLLLDGGAEHPRHVGRCGLWVPGDERRVPSGLRQLLGLGPRHDGGHDEHDGVARGDGDALRGVHGGEERPPLALAGVLRHDGRAQGVSTAGPDAEPEAEEAERGHDGLRRVAKGETRRSGARGDERQREAVGAAAADRIAEPAEEEVAHQGAAVHGGVQRRSRRGVGRPSSGIGEVDAAEQAVDERDGVEVVGAGEESCAGDHGC
nr:unnamed protein product [Digitaria exilis]